MSRTLLELLQNFITPIALAFGQPPAYKKLILSATTHEERPYDKLIDNVPITRYQIRSKKDRIAHYRPRQMG